MKTNPTWQRGCHSQNDRNGKLEIIVAKKCDYKRFDELLGDLHYLGNSKPVGDFLRQIVLRNGEWVGLLAWGPACYTLKDRDDWIGWHATYRAERQKLIVQNRRYLLLHERGKSPNLASQALAAALRALPEQWVECFGYRPVLAETFTDIERFHGTCYKACGWIEAGKSQGFGRDSIDFYVPHGKIKRLWLTELVSDARKILCGKTIADEYKKGCCSSAHGVMPFRDSQLRSLMEALQSVPDPRSKNSRFRIGSVLGIVSMALLCGYQQLTEIHRFASRLTQSQRAKIGLPFKKDTRFRQIPGYHVFYNLLREIKTEDMAQVLTQWFQTQSGSLPGALALDGKFIGDTVGVLTLADHETGAPEAMAYCSKKKGTGNTANSKPHKTC